MKEAANEMWGMIPLKARYGMFFFLGLMSFFIFWFCSCTKAMDIARQLPPDSFPEEIVEDVIEGRLGLPQGSLDLTPGSKE
jgi:hypothetical protein